jgi:hypothetical protein
MTAGPMVMKALSIKVNGHRHCLAGLPNGGVAAYVSWTGQQDGGPFFLSVIGLDDATNEQAVWAAVDIHVGDEVTIRVIDAADVDPPARSWDALLQSDSSVLSGHKSKRVRWLGK